ncbi:MAG: IMP dehydrogenase [Candidatus Levybacteria bacterium]|nr:IMP dehydrogenase [Candidatus Levybacteria bacterium]MBP9815197.1 IMP dehydrogenase [Candidatus Levybacteria bacterium]
MVSSTQLPVGLTFDDVLLVPGYSDFSRSDIDLSTHFSKNIKLAIPFISSPMDTVTEAKLAAELARLGGIGIIHRNLTPDAQADEVALVKKENLLVGAAIGVSEGYKDRLKSLVKAGVDVVVLDSAHGWTNKFVEALKSIKGEYKDLDVVVGNIATFDAAEDLCKAGADGLRVGMGPGAICTTRIISGMGVPQVTAILETVRAAKKHGVPVIADGGIKYSGDMIKALAAGAATVMMGSFFASVEEAPGKVVALKRSMVPRRFQSIFDKGQALSSGDMESKAVTVSSQELSEIEEVYYFKEYRGMGSIGAMQHGAKIKSEDEYHGKSYKDKVLVAEGVEGLVPVKGKLQDIVNQAIGGIKSGMYYVGAKTIPELQEKAQFIQITQASLTESHPHDVLITNSGKNY